MRRFHVSLAGLMAFVLFIALAISALRYSSGLFGGLAYLLSLGLLMGAVTGVIYHRNGRRAFCLGFACFGWGYVAMAYQSWGSFDEDTDHWGLVTTEILDRVRPSIESNDDESLDWFGYANAATRRIWVELEKPVSMPFGTETPLEEVVKYIKTATAGPGLERGISIYIDPVGLSESEKTMASPVVLNLEGVPLRKSLKLMLKQLDLTYRVRDGLLTITSSDSTTAKTTQQNSMNFRRVGHCLIGLVVGCLGGLATLRQFAKNEVRESSSGATATVS